VPSAERGNWGFTSSPGKGKLPRKPSGVGLPWCREASETVPSSCLNCAPSVCKFSFEISFNHVTQCPAWQALSRSYCGTIILQFRAYTLFVFLPGRKVCTSQRNFHGSTCSAPVHWQSFSCGWSIWRDGVPQRYSSHSFALLPCVSRFTALSGANRVYGVYSLLAPVPPPAAPLRRGALS